MVNRILIRIKVVQMLYAYLLTRSEFKIETEPDLSSADKKFAYTAYVDLLMLLLELTGHNSENLNRSTKYHIDKKLKDSSIGVILAADSDIKNFVFKKNHDAPALASLIQPLHDEIIKSSVYREFAAKRKKDLEDEVRMWSVLLESTIARNEELMAAIRQLPGFTSKGFDMAVEKVIDTLKSYYGARAGYYNALKSLENSLTQAHKLYLSMFVLIVRLTKAREDQLEAAKSKFLATADDKNPNTRFIDNAFAAALAQSPQLQAFIKEYAIDWTDDFTLLTTLLEAIVKSPIYQEYMQAPHTDWEKDCEFWRQIMKSVVFQSDELIEALENESVYWNDDLHIIGTFVLKSIRSDAQDPAHALRFLPQFKDEEDSRFGAELFQYSIKNRDLYLSYINMFVNTSNWDSDRIAFMDSVIMICAIAEIINFPNIPLPVSLNEYIDIANIYSSSKSGQFINGLLFSVVEHLKAEGIVVK